MVKLASTYGGFLTQIERNKNTPQKTVTLVSKLLKKIQSHYDFSLGKGLIASTNAASYSKIMNAKKGEQIKNAICGPGHQLAANALNSKGNEARVVTRIDASTESKITNHFTLAYALEKGNYNENNWGNHHALKADNMLDANEKLDATSPYVLDSGTNVIMSKDGTKVSYNELDFGRLLPNNPDKNSAQSLNRTFDMVEQNETKIDTNIGSKMGTDSVHGDYKSVQFNANFKNTEKVGRGATKVDLDVNYAFLNNEIKPSEAITKKSDSHVISAKTTSMLTSPELSEKVPVKGFVGNNIEAATSITSGSVRNDNAKKDKRLLQGRGSWIDVAMSQTAGVTTKLEKETKTTKTEIDMTAFGGVRGVLSYGVDSSVGVRPEFVGGAEVKGSVKFNLKKDLKLEIAGKASDVAVVAIDYKQNTLSTKGEATLSKKSFKGSVYGGLDYQTTKLDGLTGTKKDKTAIGGVKIEKTFKDKIALGADVNTTGKNISSMVNFGLKF